MHEPVQSNDEIPEHIEDRTAAMLSAYPPTNPNVVLETAQWWYDNGRGGTDPVYQLCLQWLLKQAYRTMNKRDEPTPTYDTPLQTCDHYEYTKEYVESFGIDIPE
jgi:hypothetical protein